MAKNRSKKDRIRADKKRLSQTKTRVSEEVLGKAEKVEKLEEIFAYNPKLIIKDLKKTLLSVVFILLILLVIALIYT